PQLPPNPLQPRPVAPNGRTVPERKSPAVAVMTTFRIALLLLALMGMCSADAADVYGVRWRVIADEEAEYHLPCERVEKAAGMEASDFDAVFPWSAIQRCEVRGQVMVEIPKHYTRRHVSDGYEYRLISAEKRPGFYVDPAFVENGKELEKIYVGAY